MKKFDTQKVLDTIEQDTKKALERLQSLIAMPSISTKPAHAKACEDTALWLKQDLESMGFAVEVHETSAHPVVVAHFRAKGPHIAFYGHYDVQPIEPEDAWSFPAFESKVIEHNGREVITGRGASDDKGQLMTFVEACRAMIKAHGTLPCSTTLIIEGDEESSSDAVVEVLEKIKGRLEDLLMVCICDTGGWTDEVPAITTSLRGIVAVEVQVRGALRDLHSGIYGGGVRNPVSALCQLVASLHDEDGKVLIEGFYTGVSETKAHLKEAWQTLGFDEKAFLEEVGVSKGFGEKGYSVLERLWSRPTCECNGIYGGYTEEGVKTIVPSFATVKITCRLVPGQDPETVTSALRKHFVARCPEGLEVNFSACAGAIQAPSIALEAHTLKKIQDVLAEEWGQAPKLVGGGGSIPVVADFERVLGVKTQMLLLGFASEKDNIHAPNESYVRKSFHKGIRSWARVLALLGQTGA